MRLNMKIHMRDDAGARGKGKGSSCRNMACRNRASALLTFVCNRSKDLFLLLSLLAVFSGCSYDREVEIVKNAVRKYNKTLIDVYRDLKTDYLFGIANPREIGHIEVIVTDFKAKNLFMEAEIRSIEFIKVKRGKNNEFDVETKEKWRFRHLIIGSKKEVRPWRDIEYNMIYRMINEKGIWLVNRAEFAKDAKK